MLHRGETVDTKSYHTCTRLESFDPESREETRAEDVTPSSFPFEISSSSRKFNKGKMQKITTMLQKECTEDLIRKKYMEMESKAMKYDPKLYSVVATEALGIHRRLLKLLGTNVIRLKDPEFTESSLRIMRENEEKEEREAEAARRKRGEECDWNVRKKVKFASEVFQKSTKFEPKSSMHQSNKKSKICSHLSYDHRLHSFEVVESKYKAACNIWEEDEDSVDVDHVSLMFENATTMITASRLPEMNLQMKRSSRKQFVTKDLTQNSNHPEEEGTIINNSINEMSKKEANNSTSCNLEIFPRKKKKSQRNEQILQTRPDQNAKMSELVDIISDSDDDKSVFEPQKVNSKEKMINKPSLDIQ